MFLTDGEYRARPTAISLFVWGIYQSRAKVLEQKFGQVDWKAIHDAATAKGGWPELGGDPSWGFFKLVVPNPRKNVGGLAAMIAAAGEYYDRTNISVADVTDPKFQKWLGELMGSVTDVSGGSAYTAEDFALFGYSRGRRRPVAGERPAEQHAGHQDALGRPAGDPLPEVRDLVRLPVLDLGGARDDRGREERRAAVRAVPALARDAEASGAQGLRPVTNDVSVTDGDTLFTRVQRPGRGGGRAPHARAWPRRAGTCCWRCCAGLT